MTEPNTTEACCVCAGGPVVYRNYRDLPFCWPCADCQCAQNPCVRTGVNDPAVSAEAAAVIEQPVRHTADTIQAAWAASTQAGPEGCLIWTGPLEGQWQVPQLRHKGRKLSARRIAWEALHGELPKQAITTSCGTTGCVEPTHLRAQGVMPHLLAAAASRPRTPLAERFWAKVARGADDECWPWTGKISTSGYGQISRGSRADGAITTHRLAYELARGPIPEGLVVRHRCDNRVCVNPSHLELGTHRDNMRDRAERGRTAQHRGEGHPQARLTEADVAEIRRMAGRRVPQKDIASRFGIAQQTVSDITHNRRWGHVA